MKNFKTIFLRIASCLVLALSTHQCCPRRIIPNEELLEISDIHRAQDLIHESAHVTKPKKSWTFIVYMSADNDLALFGRKNILQLTRIGSNKNINIIIHLDTKVQGGKKITLRYYVENNKLILTNFDDANSQKMDSGNPQTVIDCFKWAVKNFPADHYLFDFWNHGTGIIDIGRPRAINPSTLFTFNPSSNLLELDRKVPFLDFISLASCENPKGVCFDDSTGNYLTNQNIAQCLQEVTTNILGGKKIDIIVFDACLMSMLEVANILKPYADYMVSSQEVELGTGYDYYRALLPFTQKALNPQEFARHIVQAYQETYLPITQDFTQSALQLNCINEVENNISKIAGLLIDALKIQHAGSIKKTLQQTRHKLSCTHFDEPSYIDLYHWLTNVLNAADKFQYNDQRNGRRITAELKTTINQCLGSINKAVISNAIGKNLKNAHGISIYFPERYIHNSYHKTTFGKSTRWLEFLNYFMLA